MNNRFTKTQKTVFHAALACVALILLFPVLWMMITSLKSEQQIQMTESWRRLFIPDPVKWRNYLRAMEYMNLLTCFRNSLFVTFMAVLGTSVSCTMVAYSFARLRWPGRKVIFVIVLSTMMLPPQVTMIPVFFIFSKLGLVNTLEALYLPYFFGSAFFIFLLRQFFMSIPSELEDAARIDGCGYVRTMVRVMIPQVKPAIITVVIFQFVWTWNDLINPLIYIQSRDLMTLTLALQSFSYRHSGQWNYLMAASFMMTIPVMLIFVLFQRHFVRGVTFTGIRS